MDYSLTLQVLSSKSSQQTLDKVQNQALRFISGAMKTTPTDACEIHTNIAPMSLRREAAVVETCERFRRLEENNPYKKLTESTRPIQRIKKKSILSVAEGLKEKYRTPDERDAIDLFDINDQPSIEAPTIKQEVKMKISNKNNRPSYPSELSSINN